MLQAEDLEIDRNISILNKIENTSDSGLQKIT